MNKLFVFWGDHPVLSTVVGCVLMILFGIALLFRPMKFLQKKDIIDK